MKTTRRDIEAKIARVEAARKDARRVLRTQRLTQPERDAFHAMLAESEATVVDLRWAALAA